MEKIQKDETIVMAKLEKMKVEAEKALKREKWAMIITLFTTAASLVLFLVTDTFVLYLLPIVIAHIIIVNHFSARSAEKVYTFSGYLHGAMDADLDNLFKKHKGLLDCDNCDERDNCEINEPVVKKTVKKTTKTKKTLK